ncbi:hypothetical protein, partial [Burkholderia multivorans]|uniref:hypothetical protein n=1 Tax=Burkholderia multivorans TaxID=87883 RepID=UPI001C27C75C
MQSTISQPVRRRRGEILCAKRSRRRAALETTERLLDLPPANRASRSLVKFVFGEEDEHEEALYGTANHRVSEGSRG